MKLKKINKLFSLMLAATMCLTVVACGQKEQAPEGASAVKESTVEAEPTEEAATQDVPTITWVLMGDQSADLEAVLEKANEITVEEVGAKLNIEIIDAGAYEEKMILKMSSGEDWDLCFTGYINNYASAVQKGGFLDITDMIAESSLTDAVPEYTLDMCKIAGRYSGIPNYQIMTGSTGLGINKALADEYGLDVESIDSLEDIEPFLIWVKENHPEIYPFRTAGVTGGLEGELRTYDSFFNSIYVNADDAGNLTYGLLAECKDYLAEANLLHDWYQKGYIRQDVASVVDDTEEYRAGQYAVWRAMYKPGGDAEFNNSNSYECYMIQISEQRIGGGSAPSAGTAINAQSKNPELAFRMLEEINTNAELFNLLVFGIEGEHYTIDENGCAVRNTDSGYASIAGWKLGSVFNTLIVPGQSKTVWEDTAAFNDAAIKSPLMGFTFDNSKVRTEIGQVQTVYNEYSFLNNGYADPTENIDKYIAALKDSGIEVIMAELQRQIEEWQAVN